MIKVKFPTSKDIYIEVNGKKLAVVESYKVRANQNSQYIEAFGRNEPVGVVSGRKNYVIELSKAYICSDDGGDNISFYDLHNFNLVIVKPDKKIIYSCCEWSSITETMNLNNEMVESIRLIAGKRMEIEL